MATPQRLYLLALSYTTLPIPSGPMEMVSSSYLIQMSEGQHILIDTGLPADYVSTPPPHYKTNVIELLESLGLRADDISILVCTHFDPDHCGYNDSFPNADIVVQRGQYELARSGHPRYEPARSHWDNPALHYRLIDGDTELLPGITLIETSGHAPAHQSVLVKLPNMGNVLLAIDAVVMERLFTPERKAWPTDDNEAQLRASTSKLLDLVGREHIALTVFGHDGGQWQTLKTAPAYYD